MMRSVAIVALSAALLCAGSAVSPSANAEAFTNYEFETESAFPAPDNLVYEIEIPGAMPNEDGTERKGEGTFATKLIETGEYPKLHITYTGTEPGGQELSWSAYLEAKTLKPWGYNRLYTDERGTEQLDLNFEEGNVRLSIRQVNGEQINRQMPNIERGYGLLPTLMLIGRGLVFETGNLFTTMFLDPDTLSYQTPFFSILGTELITVPAGVYECYKVEIKVGQKKEYGYYAIKNPRIIARYETGDRIYNLKRHAFIAK